MNRDLDRIDHMLLSIEKILTITAVPYDEFMKSFEKQDAASLNFAILGEAAGCLSDEFRAGHPEIPWSSMIGMRNVLIHDYIKTDYRFIWEAAKKNLPSLKTELLKIRKSLS